MWTQGFRASDELALRLWLVGAAYLDSSTEAHSVSGLGDGVNVNQLLGPSGEPCYQLFKADPFGGATDYAVVAAANSPALVFGSKNWSISSYIKVISGNTSGHNLVFFQRGQSNGGFTSEIAWWINDSGDWALTMTDTIGTQMLGGATNNPPTPYLFVWQVADGIPVPAPGVDWKLYEVRRRGAAVTMVVDNVEYLPSATGALALSSASFAVATGTDAVDVGHRSGQAYSYYALFRDYKIRIAQ